MNEPLKLHIDGRTDAERAKQARDNLRPLLEQVCEMLQEIKKGGIIATFNLSPDQFGNYRVQQIDVTKPL
jgi:hypothetical protein